MGLLGLDLGTKTIGVAKADRSILIATGISTLKRKGLKQDIAELAKLVAEFEIDQIILGLPLNMDGSINDWGREVQEFGRQLEAAFGLEVVLWDERLTTAEAERILIEADLSRKRRKEVINTQAAVIILQNYLDYLRRRNG